MSERLIFNSFYKFVEENSLFWIKIQENWFIYQFAYSAWNLRIFW